ncbi:MAG: acetyl-CoA carboxylase biotin carboxyl carrier protein subunit [Bacteroidales bacterium]|jgi:biotin carboxyl carrier protein|nr:acetyl-CoA carboxylase biotin carboxyl carrier protein subunit [Bacteroidales bacterium]MCK9447955.1 acetyl-CoA carboxylase biotin carboxyl carrier protein subunit [Bacteroidales bacterium]MDD3701018.1 acetyl-CoA carboxylase biotin carboxyl carrier protein subunit [Bacteroidales bacterium]MDY0370250.1 acetyl-CoA carboxylase biotin carboxyl carrier protein subunit [Bacteroidales bacterium]
MPYEIKINEHLATVDLLSREGSSYLIAINNKVYELDAIEVERGVYSILSDNRSFNIELVAGKDSKSYIVNTQYDSFNVKIIDAETKYQMNRRKDIGEDDNMIVSPMPGKVVRILFKEGDKVKAGETVIIVSAMKMESEYKVKQDRTIKRILVKEGDSVNSDQPMVIIE